MKNINNKKIAAVSLVCLMLCFCTVTAHAVSEPGSAEFFEERDLIARAVELTAPNASYVARLAIASVIVNRAQDPRFPSDIRSVIYERGAFECVTSPDFETCDISYLSKTAARDALLGYDVSSGALYFKKGNIAESDGSCFYHSGFLFYREMP